jgi:hypothetical protein
VVLLTPWALKRPYIWLEIGAMWAREKRIVGILHGLTPGDLAQEGTPGLLRRIDSIDLNSVDGYFAQLRTRITAGGN